MVFIKTFVFSFLLHLAIGGSMLVHDLFFKASGSTFSNLPRNCSYDCTQISNKMVTFDTGRKICNIYFDIMYNIDSNCVNQPILLSFPKAKKVKSLVARNTKLPMRKYFCHIHGNILTSSNPKNVSVMVEY